jgi:hypothetical protein
MAASRHWCLCAAMWIGDCDNSCKHCSLTPGMSSKLASCHAYDFVDISRLSSGSLTEGVPGYFRAPVGTVARHQLVLSLCGVNTGQGHALYVR